MFIQAMGGSAEEGNGYFVLDITIENLGDEDESFSSLMQFELSDGDGRKQSQFLVVETNGSMDGTAPSDGKLTGEIAYEANAEGELTLTITPDAFGKAKVKFLAKERLKTK